MRLNPMNNSQYDPLGGRSVMLGNVGPKGRQIGERCGCPRQDHLLSGMANS